MFVDGTQFSSWLGQLAWQGRENSVMGLLERSFPAWGPGPASLGSSGPGAARWMPAEMPGLSGTPSPPELPSARPQPMPAAEPALPDGTGGTRPGGCQRERGVWPPSRAFPGCRAASARGPGHLRDAARDTATTSTCLGQDTPAPQPVHSQSLIFVSSKGSVELKAWCHGLPLSCK